jgi:hypothetical protein
MGVKKIIVSIFLFSRINIRWFVAVIACMQMAETGSSVLKYFGEKICKC